MINAKDRFERGLKATVPLLGLCQFRQLPPPPPQQGPGPGLELSLLVVLGPVRSAEAGPSGACWFTPAGPGGHSGAPGAGLEGELPAAVVRTQVLLWNAYKLVKVSSRQH